MYCKQIALSDTFEETLLCIVSDDVTRFDFKLRSHQGVIWQKVGNRMRAVDAGNYAYSVLWQICIFYGCRHKPSLERLYHQAGVRYPTLDLNHNYTTNSLIMQGDAMEVSLAIARETGPAIDPAVARGRLAYNASVRDSVATFNRILRFIHVAGPGDLGYPPVKYRPPVADLCQSIVAAPAALSHRDVHERERWLRKFLLHASDHVWQVDETVDDADP